LFQLAPSMPDTDECESGLLPTPTQQDSENDGGPSQYQRNSIPLNALVKLPQEQISDAVKQRAWDQKQWPTPTERDYKSGRGNAERQYSELTPLIERQEPSGSLNPEFVEWLMGYPIEWTDLRDSEMPSSRRLPSGSCRQSEKT
jgi:DNA (cytosine-5)-methyltransferase 1